MTASTAPDSADLLLADGPQPDPAGQRPHLLLSSRPWLMVFAQFFPIIALAATYPLVVPQLSANRFGGVGLAVLIVSCAVITPTLAQAVAAPVYLHILGERAADPAFVARTVLRVTVPAVLLISPLVVAVGAAVGVVRQLPLPALGAFILLLLLHVLMGALMVPAYALRAAVLLVLPWTAYVIALLIMPTQIWSPPTAAILVEVVVLAAVGVRRPRRAERPRVSLRSASSAALRGAAEGLPLWSIPVVVWLVDVRMTSIGFIYIALLPGVLAHQLFFVRVVDPGWRRLEEARIALTAEPYAQARARFERFGRSLHSGTAQVVVLLAMLSLVLVSAAVVMHWARAALVVVIVIAASTAVVAMMQSYTVAMVGSVVPLAVLGGGSILIVASGIALRAPDLMVLLTAAIFYFGCAIAFAATSVRTMRRPEYALFWRGAAGA